jgi:hypothetical protein
MNTKEFYMNFIFRHLKRNERKFNGTLNDTRFGLKARVRFFMMKFRLIIFEIVRDLLLLLH